MIFKPLSTSYHHHYPTFETKIQLKTSHPPRNHAVKSQLLIFDLGIKKQVDIGWTFVCFKLIIIAVMESNRKYRPLTSRRQHQSPLDRKIRQLEEISQNQSRQVKQLLHHQIHQLPSQINRSKPTQIPSPHRSFQQSKPQTARKRYRCEDFMQRWDLDAIYSKKDDFEKGQDLPLIPAGVEILADRQIDQQMQYLKSEEYRKYLERVAQGISTHEKVRIIKQSRNHNIYLGKAHRQPSSFQRSMQYPPLSPIPASNRSFYDLSPRRTNRNAPIIESYRAREYSNSPLREKIKTQQYKQPDKNSFAYIKIENQQEQPPLTPRNPIYNHNLNDITDLSPFAREKFESQEQSLQKQTKKESVNLNKPEPRIQNFRKSVSPLSVRAQGKQAHPVKSVRADTYRKQIQFCNNRQSQINKKSKQKKSKNIHKYSYGFKILDEDKENEDQGSLSQRSYSSSPSQKGIYKISFKINKPDRSKSPYRPPKEVFKPKQITANTNLNLNKYYPVKNKQNYQRQACKKLLTQPFDQRNDRPLQESQTNSTAAKTENTSKSFRKISLISKSKLK